MVRRRGGRKRAVRARAPMMLPDGPNMGERRGACARALAGDVVVMDNLGSHKGPAVRRAIELPAPGFSTFRPTARTSPDRERLREAQSAPAQGRRANQSICAFSPIS